ncbi:MAG: DUF6184 family natural product biosynthesis lipoprotein [Polyangiaceae bacterium]
MKTLRTMFVVSLAGAGMVMTGCQHTQDRSMATSSPATTQASQRVGQTTAPAGRMGATNVQPGSATSVVETLAEARCDREQTCGNVGDGKKYASRNVCMDQQRGGIANDLNPYQCPGGIDEAAVQGCLTAVSVEECGVHPLEAITRMEKCRKGAMCRP